MSKPQRKTALFVSLWAVGSFAAWGRVAAILAILFCSCWAQTSLRPAFEPVEGKTIRAATKSFRRMRMWYASVAFNVLYAHVSKASPGEGFDGATAQPDARGDSLAVGYTRKAIARWDVVPFQTFAGKFTAGVVSFHVGPNGMDFVRFIAEGGTPVDVDTMRINPLTGVTEYCCLLDAADFEDGQIEVRAIAYPVDGVPKILETMYFNANSGGTVTVLNKWVDSVNGDDGGAGTELDPYETTEAAANSLNYQSFTDAHIFHQSGSYLVPSTAYPHPNTDTGYISLEPAAGVARSSVIFTGKGLNAGLYFGIYADHIRFRNVTVQPSSAGDLNGLFAAKPSADMWLDNCVLIGLGRLTHPVVDWTALDLGALMMNDCDVSACTLPPSCANSWLSRNVTVDDTGGGGGTNIGGLTLLINYTVTGTDSSGYDADEVHAHVLQTYGGGPTDIILYGVNAPLIEDGLGFLTEATNTTSDIALVNCYLNNVVVGGGATVFYPSGPTVNMLVKDSTFLGTSLWNSGFTASDVVLDNVTFDNSPGAHAGVIFR
jgi:hypothetical protein